MATLNVPGTFPTIAAAVAAAASGDTILIDASYGGNESVVVDVYNLTFNAPASVPNIVLTAGDQGGAITRIVTAGDSAFTIQGNALNNIAVGNAASNIIDDGGAGNDTLNGAGGNDFITVTGGTDSVNGGAGTGDVLIVDYSAAAAPVTNTATTVTDIYLTSPVSGTSTVTFSNIEVVAIYGGSGADQFQSFAGSEGFYGNGGSDSVTYFASTAGVDIDLDAATASGGFAQGDFLDSIENVTGSAFADSLTGNGENNTLRGLAENDVLNGGDGDDTLEGGAGNDVMDGGAGIDTASYVNATAGVRVKLGFDSQQGTMGAGLDTLSNFERLTGSAFNDKLTGDANVNILLGGLGNDSLIGGGGTDTMDGGAGDDTYTSDGDTIQDTGSGGRDVIVTSVSTALTADSGIEVLKGAVGTSTDLALTGNGGDNRIIGNDGDNELTGLAGVDSLMGGLGDDLLDGGTQRDTLNGEEGADTFFFATGDNAATTTGFDIVSDFVSGLDVIDLTSVGGSLAAGEYAETTAGSDTFSAAKAAATAAMAGGTVSVVFVAATTNGWLFWDTDADLATAEQAARLNGLNDVSDFSNLDVI
jgi:Ca2+-binding RTX toxin-like protein